MVRSQKANARAAEVKTSIKARRLISWVTISLDPGMDERAVCTDAYRHPDSKENGHDRKTLPILAGLSVYQIIPFVATDRRA